MCEVIWRLEAILISSRHGSEVPSLNHDGGNDFFSKNLLKSARKGVGYWIQSKEREQVTDGRVEVEISFVSHVLNFQLKFVKSTTFSCKIYNPHL